MQMRKRPIPIIALAIVLGLSFGPRADNHYFPLSKIFSKGKCTGVVLNFELLKDGFKGGEFTQHKILDAQGEAIETISTFINKERDQWAIVGSKRDEKVIFCLYASGIGKESVARQTLKSE